MKHLSAGISLAVLSVGFTLLGLLELINGRQGDLAGAAVLENKSCIIGSIVSIFAGAIFLVAGWVYWSRSPAAVDPQHLEEQVESR